MRPSLKAAWCFPLVLLPLACPSVSAAQPLDAKAIDAVLEEARKFWEVPGLAVAVVRNDEVVYLKGVGVKELGKKDPVTPDTLFAVGSCTKAFTTAAVAVLVDEGKMGWDDPVRKHLPSFRLADPLADANVTLRDLLTHRTGLRGHDLLWYHSPWTQEEIIRKLGLLQPDWSFRSGYHYQSIMYTAAGHAVAAAAKTSWADFVQKRLLDPLGMKGAVFTTEAALKAADHASPHRRTAQGPVAVIPWYPVKDPEPAGSVVASARDMSRWLRFQLGKGTFEGKGLVSARSLAETHTPQTVIRLEGSTKGLHPETGQMSYAMGWVVQDYRGRKLVSHAGMIDGFRGHVTLAPEEGLGLVVLANLHETRLNLAVSNTLVDLLLGLPRRDWNGYIAGQLKQEADAARAEAREREEKRHHNTKPSRELSAYAGTYEEPAYGTVQVTLERGTLVWRWHKFTSPLRHWHYDTFAAGEERLGDFQVVFTLGPGGEVSGMKVLEPFGVEFKKAARTGKR